MGIWLGRKRIPPLPNETVLTDRSDGKFWRVINTNGEPDIAELQSVDRKKYWLYEAFRGPVIAGNDGHFYRLYADAGVLSVEKTDTGRRTPPVLMIDGKRPLDVKEADVGSIAISTESGEKLTTESGEVIIMEEDAELDSVQV